MGLFDFLKKGKQADNAPAGSKTSGPEALIDLGMTAEERKNLADAIHKTGLSMGRSMADVERAILSGKKVPAKMLIHCKTALENNFVQSMMTGRGASREEAALHNKLQELLREKEAKNEET